ncbi:hypothetical protein KXD40_007461 [Peronospora effusa]|uniref:Uncharacterized protein n=1 Tax=Peronospora effusa TaxID=542832 RepID=A0A3M6VA32_9STRA|nr:hypothetical protein DD238_006568 [Peronospora effusa]RQM12017.1 hypothetical protein DD237_006953 [Peronospora effusa]UIZ29082.1 hypothetical protein KXD40_007461 [Peronospora effusa]
MISLSLKYKLRKIEVDGLVNRVKKIKRMLRAANRDRDATANATKAKEDGQEIVGVKFDALRT